MALNRSAVNSLQLYTIDGGAFDTSAIDLKQNYTFGIGYAADGITQILTINSSDTSIDWHDFRQTYAHDDSATNAEKSEYYVDGVADGGGTAGTGVPVGKQLGYIYGGALIGGKRVVHSGVCYLKGDSGAHTLEWNKTTKVAGQLIGISVGEDITVPKAYYVGAGVDEPVADKTIDADKGYLVLDMIKT